MMHSAHQLADDFEFFARKAMLRCYQQLIATELKIRRLEPKLRDGLPNEHINDSLFSTRIKGCILLKLLGFPQAG